MSTSFINKGISIAFWLRIENYNLNSDDKVELVLLRNENSRLRIIMENGIIFHESAKRTDKVGIIQKGWNLVTISIKPSLMFKSAELVCQVNSKIEKFDLNFDPKTDLNELVLFNGLVGQVSSVLLFSKYFGEENLKILNDMPYGIYSETKLMNLNKTIENNYLANSDLAEHIIGKGTKQTSMHESIKRYVKTIYIPCRSRGRKIIDNISNYDAFIQTKDDLSGITFCNKVWNKISCLGGPDIFLPFIEMCFSLDLFTEEVLRSFLILVNSLVNHKKSNTILFHKNSFFDVFSLFLERMNESLFTIDTLSCFINIGKNLFSFTELPEISINYFDKILLNRKVINKLSTANQKFLWQNVYAFFVSDPTNILSFIKPEHIINLLFISDKNKYHEMCCSEHLDMFKNNSAKIMNPTLKEKTETIFSLMNMVVHGESNNSHELVVLAAKMLVIDNSFCLANGILDFLISILTSEKIYPSKKFGIFEKLLSNNLIDILNNTFKFGLMDTRIKIASLFGMLEAYGKQNRIPKVSFDLCILNIKSTLLCENLIFKEETNQTSNISNQLPFNLGKKTSYEEKKKVVFIEEKEESYKKRWSTGKSLERCTINTDRINSMYLVGGENAESLLFN